MTPLYERMAAHEYGNPEVGDLMRKIWAGTPWMIDCYTERIGGGLFVEIMQWCRRRWGVEAWPIHSRPGRWQSGSATVDGWTWFGFESEEMLAKFKAQWETRP
jgi:hypothetical protein